MYQLKCFNCGSSELGYEKWVKCQDKVLIQTDGQIEYYDQQIDDCNVFGVGCRYICRNCRNPILLHGEEILNEKQLDEYLDMSFTQREEMQDEYEQILREQAQNEEELDSDKEENYPVDPEEN